MMYVVVPFFRVAPSAVYACYLHVRACLCSFICQLTNARNCRHVLVCMSTSLRICVQYDVLVCKLRMCALIDAYEFAYLHTYVLYVFAYIYVYVHLHNHEHVLSHTDLCVCVCVCVCVYVFAYMCLYILDAISHASQAS
jgi:hypothetical protein